LILETHWGTVDFQILNLTVYEKNTWN